MEKMLLLNLLSVWLFQLFVTQSKVWEIYSRDHFHDFAQDTPVGARWHAIIAFYNDTRECQRNLQSLRFNADQLPSIDYMFVGKYEMTTFPERIWYEIEDHLDMSKKFGINDYINKQNDDLNGNCECPILVFVPASYVNNVGDDYLSNPSINDIKIFDEHKSINKDTKKPFNNWREWVWYNMKQTVRIIQIEPFDLEITILHDKKNPLLGPKETDYVKIIRLDSMKSHLNINVWPGDEIYISENPNTPQFLKSNKRKNNRRDKRHNINGKEPYNDNDVNMNPKYTVFPEMKDIYIKEFENGNFGFETNERKGVHGGLVKQRHSTTYMTHTRNLVIPKILPHNDKLGFTKIKMPPGLHERLKRFYRDWYHERTMEGWDDSGTQLNFFDIKTYMISLDHNFNERNSIANDVVKQTLMEWNGGIDLEFTAFYGIREYSRGAVLRNHVDRVDTHVYSVVLQVGQSGIDSDWPLEVIGFDGKRYEITVKPGEMILYEGHGLMHGRPAPFNGTLFSNAFCHFKPKGWDWTTNKVWKSKEAQDTLKLLHTSLRDIYR